MDIPINYICPITLCLMTDPWIDMDGNTYEKKAIEKWFSEHDTSPITGISVSKHIVLNRALRDEIQKFNQSNQFNQSIQSIQSNQSIQFNQLNQESLSSDGSTIIMVADTSGSMNEVCDNKNSSEVMGFTRLDLVKHTMNTLIESLEESDRVALVKFDSSATALTKIVNATHANKDIIKKLVYGLQPYGGTNIWHALSVALELSKSSRSKTEILLFTDGDSNENPPRGIIPTLKSYFASNEVNISIHTFGFGNNINSNLLYDISREKDGIFGFIPDSTMIGTVFINSLAYLMTNKNKIKMNDSDEFICRGLISVIGDRLSGTSYARSLKIDDFVKIIESSARSEFIDAVLLDCKATDDDSLGQISKAFEPKYFDVWGKHYLYSVLSAYLNKLCLNFKDKGVQYFKSDEFNKAQEHIENIFVNMAPPIPSSSCYPTTAVSSQVFTQSFYNVAGGCFTPSTLVKAEGGFVRIDNVKKDDNLVTPNGLARVVCVVKLKFSGTMCTLGTTTITPFHPVCWPDEEWEFPDQSNKFMRNHFDGFVYDFVLDRHHIIELNGFNAVTLGHGFEGEVIKHNYFGRDIINDLIKIDGWDNGYIVLDHWEFVRDSFGKVCGMTIAPK